MLALLISESQFLFILLSTIISVVFSTIMITTWTKQALVTKSSHRYRKCFYQDLKNSLASLFSHHIGAEGCKNKGFRHFLAKKSISNCLAWMKTRCSIPSSFCSLFFILFFILSHLGSDYMVIFFCLAQSHVKMLQFKPNRRLLAQFVEQIY